MSPRYIFRLIEAFFKKFKAIIIVGIIAGILVFLGLSFILPNLDSTSSRIGISGRYTTDNIPFEVTSKITEGLTNVDINGNVSPAIAKAWETPDGGKTWLFKIDTNKVWQDGKKIKPQDINYQFTDASSEIVDSETIKFKLNSQFSAFPIIVSKPIFKNGLVGSGEWKINKVSVSAGYLQKIEIRNKKSDRISYKFYPSDDRLKLAFKLGEVDKIINLQDPDDFVNWKRIRIDKEINYNSFVGIFLNTEDDKLSDKSIRQSLNYSINKDGFDGERAMGPISPFSWAYNPQVKPYIKDLEKAKDTKGLKITLSALPNLLKTAEMIKKEWQEQGIDCDIQIVSDVPDKFQAFLATVDIPKDPDQYSLWHSTQVETNISHFRNARIDKLLEDGRTELDQETRKKIYLDFQRFLIEDAPAIFLYHPNTYSVSRK